MLTSPLCVVAFGIAGQSPQFAIGFLLPLLCAGDGFTSTFAHGAEPLVNIFLIPQRLPKVEFISIRVLIFTWIKIPFFIGWGLVTVESLRWDLVYLPLVPVGAWLGVRLGRKISEEKFSILIYVLTLLAGL